jgi:predicted phage terminase large subunit-like protein
MLTRNEAHQEYKRLAAEALKEGGDAPKQLARALALGDLFYLLVFVFGRKDVDRDWLYMRCREVQANPDGYLDIWAREHYKSTIITYALTIQNILNDPELTVGIFSHTRPIAKGFLRQIKREFEGNPKLKALFPGILYENPSKESPKWSEDDGIVVKRKTNPKEATVEAWGLVDGQPTSKHFKLRIYDDVVTKESVSNPDMIKKVTDSWELSLNLGSEGGRVRHLGTFYHFSDTYKTIIERQTARLRLYPVTKDGTLEGEPVLISRESMLKKRKDMGPYTFGTQMLLNPKGDNVQGFEESWLRFWPANHYANLNKIILVDPANEKKKGSDYSTFNVIGLGEDENFYIIDMIRDRLSLTERANTLFRLHREFRPYFVGYEKYGKDADIDHFKDRMNRENYRFAIRELGGQMGKNDRIRRLVPLFEAHRIYLPDFCVHQNYEGVQEDLTKVFVNEEYLAFPVAAHDDMMDCLARICDDDVPKLWPEPDHREIPPWMVGSVGERGIPAQITEYDVYEGGQS